VPDRCRAAGLPAWSATADATRPRPAAARRVHGAAPVRVRRASAPAPGESRRVAPPAARARLRAGPAATAAAARRPASSAWPSTCARSTGCWRSDADAGTASVRRHLLARPADRPRPQGLGRRLTCRPTPTPQWVATLASNAHGPYPRQGPIAPACWSSTAAGRGQDRGRGPRQQNSDCSTAPSAALARSHHREGQAARGAKRALERSSRELKRKTAYNQHVRAPCWRASKVVLHHAELYPPSTRFCTETWNQTPAVDRGAQPRTRRAIRYQRRSTGCHGLPLGRRSHASLCSSGWRRCVRLRNFEASRTCSSSCPHAQNL